MKRNFFVSFRILLLLMIPMLYSLLFIGSMMDPYSKISHLPVAVVYKNTNVKESTAYKVFKEKKIFSYEFLNKKDAIRELKNGEVYGIVDFEDQVSASDKKTPTAKENTTIRLTTAEGLNYTVSKIISGAMEKYTKGINQLMSSPESDQNNRGATESVKFIHKEAFPVKNNGEGMTPYFFALTLFIGAIATNSIAMAHFKVKNSTFSDYWKKVFFFPLVFILGQVCLMTVMDYYILGFGKNHILFLFCTLFLVSITYYSIVTAVSRLFPGIGGLLVLVLTMLQTSSSAGSYAIYLSNPVFQWINKGIPMTYSVMIFRKVISLNNLNINYELLMLLVFFILSQLIIYLSFSKQTKRKERLQLSVK